MTLPVIGTIRMSNLEVVHRHDRFRIDKTLDSIFWLVMEPGDEPANVLTSKMLNEMLEAIQSIEDRANCLIVAGEENFSAGADLRKVKNSPSEMRSTIIESFSAATNRLVQEFRSFPAPVIAAVSGTAAGGGVGLVLASDFIYMHEDAKLDPRYFHLGLSPDAATTFFLAVTVGPYQAREILFDPEPLSATRAHELSLATKIFDCPEDQFFEEVGKTVERFTDGPTATYEQTKKIIEDVFDELAPHFERERDNIRRIDDTNTFSEGLDAFFDDREPEWPENQR